jgi:hypothetical protein
MTHKHRKKLPGFGLQNPESVSESGLNESGSTVLETTCTLLNKRSTSR